MNVTLTEEEWARLLNAAALAPYAQIAPVIEKVAGQITSQRQTSIMKGTGNGPMEAHRTPLS